MRLKLRGRVILLTLVVALAAIALASTVLNILLERGFTRYLRTGRRDQVEAAIASLADYYRQHGTWTGLSADVFLPGYLLAVEDAGGRTVLVRRPGRGMGRGMMSRADVERLPIEVDGITVGRAVFLVPPNAWNTGAERELRRAIDGAVLIGGLSAAALAILLGLVFARRLVRPLARIEQTARAMARGDLDQRASVGGRDEVAVLAESLNDLAGRIQDLLEERRRLSADLAHELRTPLAAIRSLVESFADGVLPADAEHLAQVREEIDRLQVLTERIQEAFLAPEKAAPRETVDLRDLAAGMAERFAPRYREKGVRLAIRPAEAPAPVIASARQLETALGNLLDNALKYSPAGSTVTVGVEASAGEVRLSVADQGPGITPRHLPRIFDRLYRIDPSRSRGTGGYGLGLAIVKEIVESHGGSVAVASAPGEGSWFTISLPRGASPD